MENQMTEFEKFLFFSRKKDELDELKSCYWLLNEYAGENSTSIRKALRISAERWSSYFFGEVPLPDGFMVRFENKFSEKIRACKKERNDKEIDHCLNILRVHAPKNLTVNLTPIGPIEGELEKIVNPQNDPATV